MTVMWPSYLEWFGLFGHAVQCVDGEWVPTIQVPPTNVHLEGVVNPEKEGGRGMGGVGGMGEGGRNPLCKKSQESYKILVRLSKIL